MARNVIGSSDTTLQREPDVLVFTKRSGRGGVERIASRLVAGWRAEGLGVAHVRSSDVAVPEWIEMLLLLRATWRAVREGRPKLLFCPGNAYAIVAVLLKLGLGRRCPPVVTKISNDLRRPDMPWLLRPPYRAWLRVQGLTIDAFAALSHGMAAEIVARMGVPAPRVHVVPNPVLSRDDIAADAARLPPVAGVGRRFVAVGRLERQKNFALMLRAFAEGRRPGDTLTIIGEGREGRALHRLATTLGIAQCVRMPGHCSAVRDELARHDILLLSSAYEGQPGVIVEALSVGLDVIATDCCAGMAELLDGGTLGRLVAASDEAAFTQAIAAARPSEQDRDRTRAKAAESTIEAAVPAYLALFDSAGRHADRRLRSAGKPTRIEAIAQ